MLVITDLTLTPLTGNEFRFVGQLKNGGFAMINASTVNDFLLTSAKAWDLRKVNCWVDPGAHDKLTPDHLASIATLLLSVVGVSAAASVTLGRFTPTSTGGVPHLNPTPITAPDPVVELSGTAVKILDSLLDWTSENYSVSWYTAAGLPTAAIAHNLQPPHQRGVIIAAKTYPKLIKKVRERLQALDSDR